MWPWATGSPALQLSFPVCELGVMITPTLESGVRAQEGLGEASLEKGIPSGRNPGAKASRCSIEAVGAGESG